MDIVITKSTKKNKMFDTLKAGTKTVSFGDSITATTQNIKILSVKKMI